MSAMPRWRKALALGVLVGAIVLAINELQKGQGHEVELVLALTDVDWSRTDEAGRRELMTREKLSRLGVLLTTDDGEVMLRSSFDFGRGEPPFATTTGAVSVPAGSYRLKATLHFRADDGTEAVQTRVQVLVVEGDGRIDVRL